MQLREDPITNSPRLLLKQFILGEQLVDCLNSNCRYSGSAIVSHILRHFERPLFLCTGCDQKIIDFSDHYCNVEFKYSQREVFSALDQSAEQYFMPEKNLRLPLNSPLSTVLTEISLRLAKSDSSLLVECRRCSSRVHHSSFLCDNC